MKPDGPGDDEHKGEHEFREAAELDRERRGHAQDGDGPRVPPELE